MYMVRQFSTLAEMEHFLNVKAPDSSEVVGFNILDVSTHHEYIIILKYKPKTFGQ